MAMSAARVGLSSARIIARYSPSLGRSACVHARRELGTARERALRGEFEGRVCCKRMCGKRAACGAHAGMRRRSEVRWMGSRTARAILSENQERQRVGGSA